ncbi:MAG: hypothetical protein ACTS4Y_00495 [Candidatus Hodgkinia cicadicola]
MATSDYVSLNAIPSAATLLSPLLPIAPSVWEDWVAAIAASKVRPYCAILNPLTGLDTIALICGVCYYWTPPCQPLERNLTTFVRRVEKAFY